MIAGFACTISPLTDALIPARVTIVNDTPDFPLEIGIRFELANIPVLVDWAPAFEVGYADGTECIESADEYSPGFSVVSVTDLDEGEFVSSLLFVIVRNYFSPRHPQGDSKLLDSVDLEVLPHDASVTITNVEGPNVEREGLVEAVATYVISFPP